MLDIYNQYNYKIIILVSIMSFVAITEGISMALLLPLLSSLGVPSSNESSIITEYFELLFINLNLENTLLNINLILIVILSVQIIFVIIQTWFLALIQRQYGAYWQKKLVKAIFYSKMEYINKQKIGDLTSLCINETIRVSGSLMMLLQIFTIILTMIMYLIIAFAVSWKVTMTIVILVLILSILIKGIGKKAFKIGGEIGPLTSILTTFINEYLSLIKIIKASSTEKKVIHNVEKNIDLLRDKYTHITFLPSLARAILEYGSFLILCGIIVIGYKHLQFSTANILVVMAIFVRLLPKFNSLIQNMQVLSTYIPAFGNVLTKHHELQINSELDKNTLYGDLQNETQKDFLTLSINKASYGKKSILQNIFLKFLNKGLYVVIGESGSGKTSLINCMLGFLNDIEGNIFLEEKNIKDLPLSVWRKQMGFVPQETILFNATIEENITWGNENASKKEIVYAAKMANAHQFIMQQKEGYNSIVGEKGALLSGGQQQRISIARALLSKPKVLILDEPTSGLDNKSEDLFFQTIEKIKEKMCVILITHRLINIKDANQIIVLKNGSVVEKGTWKQLKSNKSYFQNLYKRI